MQSTRIEAVSPRSNTILARWLKVKRALERAKRRSLVAARVQTQQHEGMEEVDVIVNVLLPHALFQDVAPFLQAACCVEQEHQRFTSGVGLPSNPAGGDNEPDTPHMDEKPESDIPCESL